MPACSSDIYSPRTSFRSSSPPNSRSNSASPPLACLPEAASLPFSFSPPRLSQIGNNFITPLSSLPSSSLPEKFVDKKHNGEMTHGNSTVAPSDERDMETTRIRTQERQTGSVAVRRNIFGLKREVRKSEVRSLKTCSLPVRIFLWYLNTTLSLFTRINDALSYAIWTPVIWISAWICVFWVIIQLPLAIVKWFIRALCTSSYELSRSKRTVLISGGSTIQALHLARNFYKAGARVIVCEIDGLFGLARFSTACARFYNVPRPGPSTAAEYVDALKTIVKRERVVYFIPVSCTNEAYYDSLAKPHLEIMGCECFVPSAVDVTSLEDPLKLMERSVAQGLAAPDHRVLTSYDDLLGLYDNGYFSSSDHQRRWIMISAGPSGMTERTKFRLPSAIDESTARNLRRKLENCEISERRKWIVLREPDSATNVSSQFVTCTTMKDSRIVANVTCRLDEKRGLIPEERNDVNRWLESFFRGTSTRKINGHLSFKLLYNEDDNEELTAISCRVGVSMPYLCLTSVHPRLVWRPCRHFSRQNSVNLVVNERYKKTMATLNTRSKSSDGLSPSTRLVDDNGTTRCNEDGGVGGHFVVPTSPVLDKRDALFVYWDPLPYCAYYHLQFPFRRLAGAIRERPAQHKPPLAVVQ